MDGKTNTSAQLYTAGSLSSLRLPKNLKLPERLAASRDLVNWFLKWSFPNNQKLVFQLCSLTIFLAASTRKGSPFRGIKLPTKSTQGSLPNPNCCLSRLLVFSGLEFFCVNAVWNNPNFAFFNVVVLLDFFKRIIAYCHN